ncbi:hypothetical protein EX30DRAFT_30116 [Ascodesmis nigricans]|uniref:Autophagy-related protein 11 n=1 Tax=Ascodesmis nigricans TaxID=341454 RepID=A0A4S2N8J0_9PEZI|nr:hypothetical protein EX30DRAFT_30116 [Ascodesmis nigricans]
MSLKIALAHSGGILKVDGHGFTSLDDFKRYVTQQTGLSDPCQILMTGRSTNVKFASLGVEKDIFVYDRRQLEITSTPIIDPLPKIANLTPFPDDLESDTDIASWRTLFKNRKAWAEYAQSQAESLAQRVRQADHETSIINRAVLVAFLSLESHSKRLDKSYNEVRDWVQTVSEERDKILREWEPAVRKLMRIPVHEGFRDLAISDKAKKKPQTLCDYFDVKEVQRAATAAEILVERFQKEIIDLGEIIGDIGGRTAELKTGIEQTSRKATSIDQELSVLREDMDILVQKVRSDYDYTRQLQGPKAASFASKRAHAATFEHLPGMVDVYSDLSKLLKQMVERKNAASAACNQHLQTLALIQSAAQPVNNRINSIDAAYHEEEEQFQILSVVLQLPELYGSLLIECVHRREWSEKFTGDSQRLAEELAHIKDDEEKRRRKWHRSTGSQLPFNLDGASQPIRTEVNTRGDLNGGLPTITRKDVEQYITSLKSLDRMSDVIQHLTQAMQDLDKPNKRINKRLRGFKMGSVHEANLMGSSFMATNTEELKILRIDKANLLEKIKGYESRIRKLEDLLHRSRTSANAGHPGTSTTPVSGMAMSPDLPSGGPSHRRSSSEALIEPLQARIAVLEAMLAEEKAITEALQKEATAKTESEKEMNARITQADDTKRDLIANLEALNQQHINERKDMLKEIEELKRKLDEAYEELDRLEDEKLKGMESELHSLGLEASKLRELHTTDTERIDGLMKELDETKEEVERQRKRADEEVQRADEAEAALTSSEQATSRLVEQVAALEKQLKEAKESLETTRKEYNGNHESLFSAMKNTYEQLSPSGPPGKDANKLLKQIDSLVTHVMTQNKEFSEKLDKEKANIESIQSQHTRLQTQFDARTLKAKDLTQRLYTHNIRSIQLLERLGYRVTRNDDSIQIVKISRSSPSNESTILGRSALNIGVNESSSQPATQPQKSSPLAHTSTAEDINLLYWMESPDSETEAEKYGHYIKSIGAFDLDAFSETIINRVKKTEADFKLLNKQARAYREKYYRAREEAAEKIAFRTFKVGDLALFLPTRNQATKPWAAFNVGAPHYFLREQDSHKLPTRDWLLARITKVEERIVDLSRSTYAAKNLPPNASDIDDTPRFLEDDNPFALSDGLRWYMLDAVEEKPGAPTTPGLSSSTVAAANVDAKGSLKSRKPVSGAKKKLTDITVEQARRTGSGGGSNRSSVALTGDAAAQVRQGLERVAEATNIPGVNTAATEGAVVESVSASPRSVLSPIEKMVSMTRSRAASLRSLTGTPQPQQSSG